jgi:hypothetical protein
MASMYDATEPATIPGNVSAPNYVAGYLDGKWPSYAAIAAKYPKAVPVSITVTGLLEADVVDCESGDLTPTSAAAWAKKKIASGIVPCIYVSASSWTSAQNACLAIGVSPTAVDWWIAAYPGPGAILYPGSIAHQWIDHGPYDESVVENGWIPGRTIGIVPPVSPQKEATMVCDVLTGGILTTRADGTVDTFEGANFYGSLSGQRLSAPIVGICSTASGKGYWLVGADAMVYAFGDAPYCGPIPKYPAEWNLGVGRTIPVIGIVRGDAAGVAYTIVGDGGGVSASLYGITSDSKYTS